MGTQRSTIDSHSPAQIAKAIVKVNKTPELRRAGLRALWKLYCAPQHSVARAELENEFGLLEDNFGLYSRGVAEQLSLYNPGALALVNSSQTGDGVESDRESRSWIPAEWTRPHSRCRRLCCRNYRARQSPVAPIAPLLREQAAEFVLYFLYL